MGAAPDACRLRVLVVGAGLAGLSAALAALESGASVLLLSRHPATRSPGSAFRGGFNAAEGSADSHLAEALAWGGPGASAGAAKARCEAAQSLAEWLGRCGVPFDRDGAGLLRHRLAGASRPRTLSAGAAFGRQVLHALDAQARRFEREGRLARAEGWQLADLLRDGSGACRGAVAVRLHTLEARAFVADAVVLAAGGGGGLLKPSACALGADGAAVGLAHRLGARLRDADRLAWAAAVPGPDKDLAVPPLLLAHGAASSAESLDLRALGKPVLKRWGGTFPRLAAAFTGRNPAVELLPLREAVTGTLGGLRVDGAMATDLPGLFAAGEAAWGGFGARALPGDEALAWIHQGRVAGGRAAAVEVSAAPAGFEAEALEGVAQRLRALHTSHGGANPGALFAELAEVLSGALGPEGQAEAAPGLLEALALRADSAMWVKDRNPVANAALLAALDFPASLAWARSAAASAAARASAAEGSVLDATWTAHGPSLAEAAP